MPAAQDARTAVSWLSPPTAVDAELNDRFRPLFERIKEGNRDRERERIFAHEQVRWLIDAGFSRLRIPERHGGSGASLQQTFRLLAELGAADANIAHVFRNHWAFVEDRLYSPPDEAGEVWLERFRAGDFVGGGWTEANGGKFSDMRTRLSAREGATYITGAKFYATGSLYADWLDVIGVDESGAALTALVRRDQPGVELIDDWPGFGQRTTASGSARYDHAEVDRFGLFPAAERFPYQGLFYQTSLLAILAGIARAAWVEGIEALKQRRRNYPLGLDEVPARDAQLLQVIGRLGAQVFQAEAALQAQTAALDEVAEARRAGADVRGGEALRTATVRTAEAQLVIIDAALAVTNEVFDALGASGTSEAVLLDRHWRNARTLASHNPRIYKERVLGDWYVNGTDPSVREDPFSGGGQGV